MQTFLSIRFARGNSKLLFGYLALIFAVSSTVLTILTNQNATIVMGSEICGVLFCFLIVAANQGMAIDMVCHLATTAAAVLLAVVSWQSGGIYSSPLAWMSVMVTSNYFIVGRRASIFWLGVYLLVHLALTFSETWTGFSPAVQAIAIMDSADSLRHQILVLIVLTLLMVFYQRADIALHANLIAEQQMLKKESEILEQAQRARDDFLSVISKDIIGPLRSIVQWSEQSDAARLHAPNTAMVLYYGGQSAAQACIAVEELIEYSRVSSGKIPIQIVPIDLREELQTFFSQLQTPGQTEPLAYSLHTAGDLPDTLHTDRSLLILALSKLAQCARQESHGGQILISVQLEGVSKLNISASAMSEISENEPHTIQEVHAWASGKGGALKDQSTVVAWALVQSIALRLGAEAGRQSTAQEPPRFWILLPLVPTLIH